MISEDGRVAGLYVYVQLGGKPVVAGRFLHQANVGIFYYGNSYIQREDAFALDPINLPLVSEREFSTRANRGYFGVLLDAGPDSWGKRVLSEIAKSRPRNEMEYLLAGNGQGIGQLLFSTSSTRIKLADSTRITPVDLESIEHAAMLIDQDKGLNLATLPQPVLRALEDSSWLGGARPKASVTQGSKQYLAKFARLSDTYDQVAAEYACLQMARDCRIDVPECELVTLGNRRKALLVERFDRHPESGVQLHYISAHSLLQIERAQESNPDHGYPGLAMLMRKFMSQPAPSTAELYRRMVFRVLICDTDDHGRNHGFLYDNGQWRLAPMFDVLPHPDNYDYQAMPIGREGRIRTIDNLLSMSETFLVDRDSATKIILEIAATVVHWRDYFTAAGIPPAQLRRLEHAFELAESIS